MTTGPQRAMLTIEFTGYWIAGEGKGGAGIDDVTYRDAQGCPAMPMTQVKGQLRETATRLWTREAVEELFGGRADPEGDDDTARRRNLPRSPLAFHGEARLAAPVRAWFADRNGMRNQLFRTIAGTRIDENGVAKDRALRRIEVAVPLTLEGVVSWRDAREPPADWVERLDQVCAAALAFGRGKNDGLGRAIAGCTETDGKDRRS